VSEFGRRADWSEGRRGSRIDLEEGGRYLGIPQIGFADTLSLVTINPVSTNSGAVQLWRKSRSPAFHVEVSSVFSALLCGPSISARMLKPLKRAFAGAFQTGNVLLNSPIHVL